MKAYHGSAVLQFDSATTGNAGSGVPVTVRINSTQALATIYDLDDIVIANPLTTDAKGNYAFKSLDDVYDIILNEGTGDESKLEKVEVVELAIAETLINDLSQAYTFTTVAAFKASLIEFPDGKVIHLLDRGADFTKVTGQSGDGFSTIPSTTVSQSIALKPTYPLNVRAFGAVADYDTVKTDNTGAIQAAIDYTSPILPSVKIDDGKYAHTGLVMRDGTVLKGNGVYQVWLINTHVSNDSVTVPYFDDMNFYEYIEVSGMRIDAENIRTAGQVGLSVDTCRHCNFDELAITNHGYNIREKSAWSNNFSNIHLIAGIQAWWVEGGDSTGGTPNTRININYDSNRYGLLIENPGTASFVWLGGSIEGTEEEAVKIVGNTNRAISFIGVNFETNNTLLGNYQVILGDDAVSTSGPSNISFKGCRFAHVGANREFVFDANRGTGLVIDECNFLGYDKVADVSSNFGSFSYRELTGISTFMDSTNASTTIPANGQGTGNRSSLCHIDAQGKITVYQSSSNNNILESRRHTESNHRFEIAADGKIGWHNFNAALADVHLMRRGIGIVGCEDNQALKTGSGITSTRPTVSVSGATFFDTTLGKPIWSNGSAWVDSAGVIV